MRPATLARRFSASRQREWALANGMQRRPAHSQGHAQSSSMARRAGAQAGRRVGSTGGDAHCSTVGVRHSAVSCDDPFPQTLSEAVQVRYHGHPGGNKVRKGEWDAEWSAVRCGQAKRRVRWPPICKNVPLRKHVHVPEVTGGEDARQEDGLRSCADLRMRGAREWAARWRAPRCRRRREGEPTVEAAGRRADQRPLRE